MTSHSCNKYHDRMQLHKMDPLWGSPSPHPQHYKYMQPILQLSLHQTKYTTPSHTSPLPLKMISSQIQKLNSTKPLSSLLPKPSILSHGNPSLPIYKQQYLPKRQANFRIRAALGNAKVLSKPSTTETAVKVKATVTVKVTIGGIFSNIGLTIPLDDLTEVFGKSFLLELVSSQLDPSK